MCRMTQFGAPLGGREGRRESARGPAGRRGEAGAGPGSGFFSGKGEAPYPAPRAGSVGYGASWPGPAACVGVCCRFRGGARRPDLPFPDGRSGGDACLRRSGTYQDARPLCRSGGGAGSGDGLTSRVLQMPGCLGGERRSERPFIAGSLHFLREECFKSLAPSLEISVSGLTFRSQAGRRSRKNPVTTGT